MHRTALGILVVLAACSRPDPLTLALQGQAGSSSAVAGPGPLYQPAAGPPTYGHRGAGPNESKQWFQDPNQAG